MVIGGVILGYDWGGMVGGVVGVGYLVRFWCWYVGMFETDGGVGYLGRLWGWFGGGVVFWGGGAAGLFCNKRIIFCVAYI